MAVNSRWWRHKIWNTLRKWQRWGPRHKQTHKSAMDRHRDDWGNRTDTLCHCYLSTSALPLSLPLSHHLTTLTLTSLALLSLPLCAPNHLSSVSVSSAQGELGPTPPVSLLPLVFQPEAQRESICPVYPSLWLCHGCSVKFRESMVWVSQGELWALEPGDPRKNQMSVLLGEGWKRKRRRERWREGNLRVQNAKCWCVCFPSLLFRAMTERENKWQHWYITHRLSTLFSEQYVYSESIVLLPKPLLSLHIKSSHVESWKQGNNFKNAVHYFCLQEEIK